MPYTPGSIPTSKKRQVSHLFVCLTFYPPSFMWLINIHRAKVGLCDFLYTYCDINETGVVNNCYVYRNGHILILNGEKKAITCTYYKTTYCSFNIWELCLYEILTSNLKIKTSGYTNWVNITECMTILSTPFHLSYSNSPQVKLQYIHIHYIHKESVTVSFFNLSTG